MSFVQDSRAEHLRLWFLSRKINLHLKLPSSIEIQSCEICGARKHLLFNIYVRPFTPCSCAHRNTWLRYAVTRSIKLKKKRNRPVLFEAFQKVWFVCSITFATWETGCRIIHGVLFSLAFLLLQAKKTSQARIWTKYQRFTTDKNKFAFSDCMNRGEAKQVIQAPCLRTHCVNS